MVTKSKTKETGSRPQYPGAFDLETTTDMFIIKSLFNNVRGTSTMIEKLLRNEFFLNLDVYELVNETLNVYQCANFLVDAPNVLPDRYVEAIINRFQQSSEDTQFMGNKAVRLALLDKKASTRFIRTAVASLEKRSLSTMLRHMENPEAIKAIIKRDDEVYANSPSYSTFLESAVINNYTPTETLEHLWRKRSTYEDGDFTICLLPLANNENTPEWILWEMIPRFQFLDPKFKESFLTNVIRNNTTSKALITRCVEEFDPDRVTSSVSVIQSPGVPLDAFFDFLNKSVYLDMVDDFAQGWGRMKRGFPHYIKREAKKAGLDVNLPQTWLVSALWDETDHLYKYYHYMLAGN